MDAIETIEDDVPFADPPSPNSSTTKAPYEVDGLDFRFESARLESFKGLKGWPHPWLQPEELAAAGFYYTGDDVKVKCFECLVEISDWAPAETPMMAHQKKSGRCRFVRDLPCGNVPIPGKRKKDLDCGACDCGLCFHPMMISKCIPPYFEPKNFTDQEVEEIVKSRPKHPEYSSYPARLASFDGWFEGMSRIKEELAAAGFYFTGSSDQTLCFHCGGEIGDWDQWEPEDDPWVMHAKMLGYCPSVISVKGTEFISNNIIRRTRSTLENDLISVEIDLPNLAIIKFGKDPLDFLKLYKESAKDENIANGSSQSSVSFDETNNTEASAVPGEVSEEQSVQTSENKLCGKD